jgi:hypothetical protein
MLSLQFNLVIHFSQNGSNYIGFSLFLSFFLLCNNLATRDKKKTPENGKKFLLYTKQYLIEVKLKSYFKQKYK